MIFPYDAFSTTTYPIHIIISSIHRAQRALVGLKLTPDSRISVREFIKINDRFPACFFPIFQLQDSMRAKVSSPMLLV